MEVLLNTTWLLVAIGAFLFWCPDSYGSTFGQRGHGTLLGILALACALVLLFPIISLTDDLHIEQAAIEDSSRSVIKARNLAQAPLRAARSPFLGALNRASYSDSALQVLASVVLFESCITCRTPISAHEGRSPPSNA